MKPTLLIQQSKRNPGSNTFFCSIDIEGFRRQNPSIKIIRIDRDNESNDYVGYDSNMLEIFSGNGDSVCMANSIKDYATKLYSLTSVTIIYVKEDGDGYRLVESSATGAIRRFSNMEWWNGTYEKWRNENV